MKYFGSLEVRLFNTTWFHIGYNLRRFGIGLSFDRWGINVDLGPIWVSIEF